MVETSTKPTANKQIAKAAVIVMAGFVLSNIISLIRTIITGKIFGVGAALDAFTSANILPTIFFNLVAGGALASAFIPTYTELLENKDKVRAWKLASSIINIVTFVLVLICIFSWVFANPIVEYILYPGAGIEDPAFLLEQQTLITSLLRILLICPIIFGVSGLFMAILNTHQSFALPALASSMYWGGMILGLLLLTPSIGIYGLAWGAVIGSALHMLIQLPGILRLKDRSYSFSFGLSDPSVREVGRLMAPRVIGVAVVQINFLINSIVASSLEAGSLAAIDYAFKIMTMPQVVIAQSIAIAALPTFSAQIARGELKEMRNSLAGTIRGILLLALPATAGLILLRLPVVAAFYQRGEFTALGTEMVAWALLMYTVGLPGHSMVEILSRAFYALHDTKTPVVVGVIAMSLNAVLSFILPGVFARIGWIPLGGLPLANTVATTLEMVILLVLIRRKMEGIDGRIILQGSIIALIGTVIMSAGIFFWISVSEDCSVYISSAVGIVIGLVIYFTVMIMFKVPEIRELITSVTARIKRA
ncbi:MAG: murein biosynthesis integral membrane protein MurJ [Anaerolineales bacterium]|nr:murein biosynthesis integral membrane protein MurJ [Anaerolineales bacterium]